MTASTPAISEPKPPAKKRERIRRRRVDRPDETGARYFLVKTSGAGQMELGEETSSENDAMVTSFRSGGTFAVVTEWKTNVDLADGHPVIKKEAVRRERS
jgi:hypothetical protein